MIVDPPLFSHFFLLYCVYNSYTHFRSFAALHHLNSAGILHISAHVAWIVDISMDILLISSGFMDLLHITRMVNQGLQVSIILIIACSCLDGDCNCMLCTANM